MPDEVALSHTFEHSWRDISLASWKKYPCDKRKDVVQLDLLEREFDPETGILKTTRLCQAKSLAPMWVNKLLGTPKWVFFIEHAEIDPRNNRMVLQSRNLTWSSWISMKEQCLYTPHPKRADWTDLEQTATVAVSSLSFPIASRLEKYLTSTFNSNAERGREVMELAMVRVRDEAKEGLVVIDAMRERLLDQTSHFTTMMTRQAQESLSARVARADEVRNGQ